MKLTLISLLLASVINIIPAPLSVKEDKGVFKLKGSPISCDSQMGDKALQAVAEFSSQLTLVLYLAARELPFEVFCGVVAVDGYRKHLLERLNRIQESVI